MLSMNTDYHEVFIPTSQLLAESNAAGIVGIILGLLAIILAIWLASDIPGVPLSIGKKTYEKLMITLTWVLIVISAGTVVSLSIGFVKYADYYGKVEKVKSNMQYNIHEKYDAHLQEWGEPDTPLSIPEPLDEPHNFTLDFSSEGDEHPVEKTYSIRFDRETNEPFVAETGSKVAPTAEELEASANK